MKHTVFVKDKPWPHNRQDSYIYMMKVKHMQGLTDNEMDFLIEASRSGWGRGLQIESMEADVQ